MTLGYTFAAVIAVVLSLLEIASKAIGISVRATPWITLRLAADVGVALLAYLVVDHASPTTWPEAAKAAIAGGAGAIALRGYVVSLGKGQGKQVGLSAPYDRLCAITNRQIASSAAVTRVDWVRHSALPALARVPTNVIISDALGYLEWSERYTQAQLAKLKSAMFLTVGDGQATSDQRVDLYRAIIAAGGLPQLRSTVKRANKDMVAQ